MNIMLDLETLGTRVGSVILSIGAYELETERKFYSVIDMKSCFQARLSVDHDTVAWWMKQSDEARQVFNDPEKVTLNKALLGLSTWLSKSRSPIIWGDGSNFDCSLLEAAYRASGQIECPWHYTKVRCYRTLKNLFTGLEKKRIGVYHRADSDAETNGLHLKAILESIGKYDGM